MEILHLYFSRQSVSSWVVIRIVVGGVCVNVPLRYVSVISTRYNRSTKTFSLVLAMVFFFRQQPIECHDTICRKVAILGHVQMNDPGDRSGYQ
mmetsp:Transcript_634/g.1327  ORF Transcript_634/g.1327 Transcript_634/m.1327 type:complete len:93 (+) Transcript_634:52-330(+)